MRPLMAMGVSFLILGAACSAQGGEGGGTALPVPVATELAARADRVAAALDAGACDQALAEARSLQSDVSALAADPRVKAAALAGAARLTAGIVCAPPTTTSVQPPAPPATREPERGTGKKDKGDDKDGGDKDRGDKDDD